MVERAFCEQYFYVTRMFGTCEGVLSGVWRALWPGGTNINFLSSSSSRPTKNPLAPQCQLTQGSSVCGTTWRKLMRSTRLEAINQFRRPKENILLSSLSLQRHTHTAGRHLLMTGNARRYMDARSNVTLCQKDVACANKIPFRPPSDRVTSVHGFAHRTKVRREINRG